MAYSDNYPNGYKSGYSSADDPNRVNYSPMGVESARRSAMAASDERERRMSEYNSGIEREKQRQQRLQQQREREEWEQKQERIRAEEHIDMHVKSIQYLCEQKRNEYKKKSWLSRAVATLSGKGYYKIPFWDLAKQEVEQMSDKELETFYRRNVR